MDKFLGTENQTDSSSSPYLIASPWEFDLPKFEDRIVSKGLWFSTLYLEDIEDNMEYTFLSQEELRSESFGNKLKHYKNNLRSCCKKPEILKQIRNN